ncbi:MAG: RNA polymerase sigma factor [Bacteroidales bacterium]|nr:RNA polymerase sigma factor [Bacteroidales bacterium]MDD2425556.1 RNA polymerase sigma factor [Bacteroidales bacterium]MDD3990030.1 RNA polymerase sigma factor [Bacteroidales bacterium]
MSDEQIIQDIISGNKDAYRELVEKYQRMVFRTAIGFLHSREDAEDITQDIFIKVYESLKSFKGKSEFSTWLYRITINTSINFANRNKKNWLLQSIENLFDKSNNEKNPLELLETSERDHMVREAIDSLPDAQRTAFVLSKYEELPQKKIALIIGKSEGAVEQLLNRAKMNLQKKLNPAVGKTSN